MACRGVHFALSPAHEAQLLAAAGDDASVLEILQETIEAAWGQEWLCQTDKAWDAIHRCLTDGRLSVENGEPPLRLCILGGQQLYSYDDYFICYVPASQVPEVADALARVGRETFDRAFSNLRDTDYEGPANHEDREYTWAYLEDLRQFWRKAASAGRSVVFSVDQ